MLSDLFEARAAIRRYSIGGAIAPGSRDVMRWLDGEITRECRRYEKGLGGIWL